MKRPLRNKNLGSGIVGTIRGLDPDLGMILDEHWNLDLQSSLKDGILVGLVDRIAGDSIVIGFDDFKSNLVRKLDTKDFLSIIGDDDFGIVGKEREFSLDSRNRKFDHIIGFCIHEMGKSIIIGISVGQSHVLLIQEGTIDLIAGEEHHFSDGTRTKVLRLDLVLHLRHSRLVVNDIDDLKKIALVKEDFSRIQFTCIKNISHFSFLLNVFQKRDLFLFFMKSHLIALRAILLCGEAIRMQSLVLRGDIILVLAFFAAENDIDTFICHFSFLLNHDLFIIVIKEIFRNLFSHFFSLLVIFSKSIKYFYSNTYTLVFYLFILSLFLFSSVENVYNR